MLRDEFLIQLQKFLNQIGLTLRQLEGKINIILIPKKKFFLFLFQAKYVLNFHHFLILVK